MLSLKKIIGKKVLDNYILPEECMEYLMFQKMYKLSMVKRRGLFDFIDYPNHKTILIHNDLNKIVLQMLKLYETDFSKLNEYDEKTCEWKYFFAPDRDYKLIIEQLSIGDLLPINQKKIYYIKKGKLQKKKILF